MLDHVTIRTSDLEGSREFLETLLGVSVGSRPAVFTFPGYWLYHDGAPIIHLVPGSGGEIDTEGEGIDHVALRLEDYAGTRLKLESMGVTYSTMDLEELSERRLFVRMPNGVLLELVVQAD